MLTIRSALYAALALSVSACYSWTQVTPYAPVSSHVRIFRRSGDTLEGTLQGRSADSLIVDANSGRGRTALAFGDIRSIEQHVFNPKRTATLLAGAAAVGAVAAFHHGFHGTDGPYVIY